MEKMGRKSRKEQTQLDIQNLINRDFGMNRSWMQLHNRRLHQYIDGGRVRFGIRVIDATTVSKKIHLFAYGVVTTYIGWVYHGEDFEFNDSDPLESENDEYFNDVTEKSNSPDTEVREIVHDIHSGPSTFAYTGETASSCNPDLSYAHGSETNTFARLMRVAEQELYPNCQRYSKLSFIVKLLHLNMLNKWSNKSFTMMLELLKDALPIGETLPCSYNEVKQIIRDLGLDYKKIHVCKNDCALFWKEYGNEDKCLTCKEPRYKFHKGKGKKIPHKVLRYFPLKPRLQSLFISRKTTTDMRWHTDKRVEEKNVMRHSADSEAWKDFDKKHESFVKDPRNVRLGLASDGFNPFGNMSTLYSIWPVFIVPYNLPPWKCMKDPFFMMPLLIPGRRAPGFDIDVFLRLLIDELNELWEIGVETYDASSGSNFQLHAALLWTINDFPTYGNLSSWSTKGKLACPSCNENASHQYLHHCRKTCYMGHRRFLPHDHFSRTSKSFNGEPELRLEPKLFSREEVLGQLGHIDPSLFGKIDQCGKKRKCSPQYLNWARRSIFFDLPYWKTLKVRHNLDVMHIEKNICDSVLGTLMNIDGKTKDTYKARLDLMDMGIRPELHPREVHGQTFLPSACFMLSPAEKRNFCEFLSSIKLPNGYASNISHCVNTSDCRITGLKSHDCHVILQRLLPIALHRCLEKDVSKSLIEFSLFFKELSSKTLRVDVLEQIEKDIVLILCKLEKIFPPSFFDIMIHLSVHLSREAILAGLVQYRWMYGFERYMHILKGYVRNKARPEGSIAEGYINHEVLTFCSMYFHEGETRFNRPERNYDGPIESAQDGNLFVFRQKFCGLGAAINDVLNLADLKKVRW
ncbi:uncharacterized protein LOC114264655 [Camellia sinensis]|uniref:uncharacterized protein LOC114264655 n=1 Tax=Camellia sinensis TaxID=4442 RepID=UPI001036A7BC|nr:uncharacterized protein LOC114264655 [Camellia sinensis]